MPLSGLGDLAFTGWEAYEDNLYMAAKKAGVLERDLKWIKELHRIVKEVEWLA